MGHQLDRSPACSRLLKPCELTEQDTLGRLTEDTAAEKECFSPSGVGLASGVVAFSVAKQSSM